MPMRLRTSSSVPVARVRSLLGQLLRRRETGPSRGQPLLRGGDVVPRFRNGSLEHSPHSLLVLLDFRLGKGTTLNDELAVLNERRGLSGDGLARPRLGEARLFSLFVSVAMVVDNFDKDILLPLVSAARRRPISGRFR